MLSRRSSPQYDLHVEVQLRTLQALHPFSLLRTYSS